MLLLSLNYLNANQNLVLVHCYCPSLQINCSSCWKPLETNSLCSRYVFFQISSPPIAYHRLIHIPQFQKNIYFSNVHSSVSDNPKRLWQTVKLLHRKSPLNESFANFVTDKISEFHISLTSNTSTPSPLALPSKWTFHFFFQACIWIWNIQRSSWSLSFHISQTVFRNKLKTYLFDIA